MKVRFLEMFDPSPSSNFCCQVGEELTKPSVLSFRLHCLFSQLYFGFEWNTDNLFI